LASGTIRKSTGSSTERCDRCADSHAACHADAEGGVYPHNEQAPARAKSRTPEYADCIQIDTSINPGNSAMDEDTRKMDDSERRLELSPLQLPLGKTAACLDTPMQSGTGT
jgi:hypothetical protein